jgi:hypothetical protein|tara:strand:+ start:506 stop:712 length:207 start_codon:yes stop_codon:yes gene_type:complete
MFIIIAVDPRTYTRKDINSFDILAEPDGRCLTFTSKSEAVKFLREIVSENEWNDYYMDNANISIDRMH